MSQTTDRPAIPSSVRHKRILDVAEEKPEASLEEIASGIPSATVDLVERILEKYGDPAEADTESTSPLGDSKMPADTTPPELDELTEKQRELLELIAEHPEATQEELGELLDVSAPTVSNWVGDIEGLDWADRRATVETVFQTRGATNQPTNTDTMASDTTEQATATDELEQRVETLEQEFETFPDSDDSVRVIGDMELLHKVLHACMKSDSITEEEEFQIMKMLLS